MSFVHLHTHTCYSLLDGAVKIPELMARVKETGMKSIAITDHGVMYGVIEFYKEALKAGIKPIIGCEVYVAPRSRFDKVSGIDDSPYHLVLLAESEEGYRNLVKLVSKSWLEGFYYKPRIDKELLRKYNKGLIALSACLAGEVASLLLQDRKEEAGRAAKEHQEIFGVNNYYLELQDHGLVEQRKVNSGILQLSEEYKIPLVVTNDVHYIRRQDAYVQDVMLCIQTGKNLQDTERMRFETEEFYLKSEQEMKMLFGDYPEALENTELIAERCQVNFEFGKNHLPYYEVPSGHTEDSYLEKLCQQGMKKRYPVIEPQIVERLSYELNTISKMGFSGYFLIVWDFINFAKRNNIFVGPGRGSAAGSLVAYCLNITDIDPLKYDLLFERFLNPERISMPDIDIDFCFERRSEVIDYVVQKYGEDRVAQIITFGTMAARGAIRDAGRAIGIPLALVDKVAKQIPLEPGMSIKKALEISPELEKLAREEDAVKELLDTAKALEGMPRHAGTHAAGLVISKEALEQYLPLQRTSEGLCATQFDKETVEEIGLLKIDLLGLRTLTVVNKAVSLVNNNQHTALNLSLIPLDDDKTYKLLSDGDTIGVFQLESSGLRKILRELKPKNFEDVIALVALYRPGPLGSGMVDEFIRRAHGEMEEKYLHASLEPILKNTHGVIVYQEQVMRIASELAGFTLGEADLLRRAMGKKKPEIIAGLKKQFLDGALQKGIEVKVAEQVFELMEYFAGYGFNKSHSAAYALLAYQTAYLKAHYPVEYLAALLTSVMEAKDRVHLYIEECRQKKIQILAPDVNESGESFVVSGNKIRFGLAAIKQVGYPAIQAIIKEREKGLYKSLQDFCERVDLVHMNRRVIENLIKAGAFSSLHSSRAQLLEVLHLCIEQGLAYQRQKNSLQLSLLDFTGNNKEGFNPEISYPRVRDFTAEEILQMEKEVLGLYLSGHPLAAFQDIIKEKASCLLEELPQKSDGEKVTLVGLITGLRRSITKRGETMAYFKLEDLTGSVESLLFPKNFSRYSIMIKDDLPILVKGRVSLQEENPKVFVEEISPLQANNFKQANSIKKEAVVYLKVTNNKEELLVWQKVMPFLASNRGESPVHIYFPEKKKMIKTDPKYWLHLNDQIISQLRDIMGSDAVNIVEKKDEEDI